MAKPHRDRPAISSAVFYDCGEESGANRTYYEAADPEGRHGWFTRVVRDPKPA